MSQRVKLQVNSDLSDVPRLSGIMLQESMIDASKLQALIEQISIHLKSTELDSEESIQKLQRELDSMDAIRVLLTKIDARVGDIASIIGGLHQVLTNPNKDDEEQKVEQNDSIAAG
jgi:hypothetical protein